MKKYAEIIVYSLIIAFFASCGKDSKKNEEAVVTTEPFEMHASYKLNEHASDSPELKIDISLTLVDTGNEEANDNINRTIAWLLFESPVREETRTSVKDACLSFAENKKKEYLELLPDYLNIKDTDMPAVWFYNYYIINGEAERGYKGCINYIINMEEFTGGAHPSSLCSALNFNPDNGEEIVLEDILKDNFEEPLIAILEKNLAKQLEVDDVEGIKEKGYMYADADMFISNNFILEKEQIVFIYNRYDIAPYSMGDIMINVSYDEIKDLMK